jgi:hypothetical protein
MALKFEQVLLLIPQLMSCTGMPGAKNENVFCGLSYPVAAARRLRHRGDSGLEEKSIQAGYSCFQLDGQQALCLPDPL